MSTPAAARRAADSLTPNEAGRVLGVDGRTVRRWVELGRVPARMTVTGRYLLDRSLVERLAAQEAIPKIRKEDPTPVPS